MPLDSSSDKRSENINQFTNMTHQIPNCDKHPTYLPTYKSYTTRESSVEVVFG